MSEAHTLLAARIIAATVLFLLFLAGALLCCVLPPHFKIWREKRLIAKRQRQMERYCLVTFHGSKERRE